jgi:uroporphyrinogen III methyltransferase / synthase
MSSSQAGKNVAVFQTPANKKIIKELHENGANVILFPTIETEKVELDSEGENLLKNLSDFDWLIFSNVFAVDYFLQALEKLEIDLFELDALRVCAFGETVADKLRYSQVHSDVISNSAETNEVFQALNAYEPDFQNIRVLIPKEVEKNVEIAQPLSEAGAVVTELLLYRTQISEPSHLSKLKALLMGGAVDEFLFSSPVEAVSLSLLFPSVEISKLLADTIVIATDATVYQSLREHRISRIIMR